MIFLRSGFRTELMTGNNKMYGLGAGLDSDLKNISLTLNLGYYFRPEYVDMNEIRIEFGFEL